MDSLKQQLPPSLAKSLSRRRQRPPLTRSQFLLIRWSVFLLCLAAFLWRVAESFAELRRGRTATEVGKVKAVQGRRRRKRRRFSLCFAVMSYVYIRYV